MDLSLYTIPSSLPFLRTLARSLIRKNDPINLAQHLILLPTRQACLEFSHLLFEENHQKPLILPRILPLGEIEEEEFFLTSPQSASLIEDLPKLISSSRRQLLLASLIAKFTYGVSPLSFDHAARLAQDLMRLIDELRTEGIPLEDLEKLNPLIENAEHWQRILQFLKIISVHWNQILKTEDVVEMSFWRHLLLENQATLWKINPPSHPILIAGSMGTVRGTAHLMQVVAQLPKGAVILPGFERGLENLRPSHPQYAFYELLKGMGWDHQSVQDWITEGFSPRYSLIRGAFIDPSEKIEDAPLSKALENFQLLEVSDGAEEAQVIALALRRNLEQDKKRALFITADSVLAKRVSLELHRWNIHVPIKKDRSFLETEWGSLLGLTALWFQKDFDIVKLISTLKHSLANRFERVLPVLEIKIIRRTWGLKSPYDLVFHFEKVREFLNEEEQFLVSNFLEELTPLLKKIYSKKPISLGKCVEFHKNILQWVAPCVDIPTTPIGDFWTKLEDASANITLLTEDYSKTFQALTQTVSLSHSHTFDSHTPIQILTPLEARLLQADFIIFGGLNEGIWPEEIRTDPFFSASMRQGLGLPSLERRIGQSTHDFMQAAHAPHVLMTRALHRDGVPTVASKFLAHLESYLQSHRCNIPREKYLREWCQHREEPTHIMPISSPLPLPTVSLRPMTLSISDIGTLMRDPYSIYAKYILKLKPLKELNRPAGALEFGLFVHEFLQVWLLNFSKPLSPEKEEELFFKYFKLNKDRLFWKRKFHHILQWVQDVQEDLMFPISQHEVSGSLSFETPHGLFTLKGRADRIDVGAEGLTLIDYKTAQPPSEKDIGLGLSPQLALEAAIILYGKFDCIPARPLKNIQFWSLALKEGQGTILTLKTDSQVLAKNAFEGLKELIHYFLHEETPYLSHPRGPGMPNTYDHLARTKEWLMGEKA
jgi:ATP-dependent helicase/nuclease subunit B